MEGVNLESSTYRDWLARGVLDTTSLASSIRTTRSLLRTAHPEIFTLPETAPTAKATETAKNSENHVLRFP